MSIHDDLTTLIGYATGDYQEARRLLESARQQARDLLRRLNHDNTPPNQIAELKRINTGATSALHAGWSDREPNPFAAWDTEAKEPDRLP